jgi:hypothetical protein
VVDYAERAAIAAAVEWRGSKSDFVTDLMPVLVARGWSPPRDATPDPRDAEIERLREEADRLNAEVERLRALTRPTVGERRNALASERARLVDYEAVRARVKGENEKRMADELVEAQRRCVEAAEAALRDELATAKEDGNG